MQQVDFVLHQNHWDMATFLLDFAFPFLNCFERRPIRRREGNDTGLGTSVVSLGDGVELFLAGSVPEHQPNVFTAGTIKRKVGIKEMPSIFQLFFPVLRDMFFEEVDTDRFLVIFCEYSFAISLDHRRLANCTVPNNHNLEREKKR